MSYINPLLLSSSLRTTSCNLLLKGSHEPSPACIFRVRSRSLRTEGTQKCQTDASEDVDPVARSPTGIQPMASQVVSPPQRISRERSSWQLYPQLKLEASQTGSVSTTNSLCVSVIFVSFFFGGLFFWVILRSVIFCSVDLLHLHRAGWSVEIYKSHQGGSGPRKDAFDLRHLSPLGFLFPCIRGSFHHLILPSAAGVLVLDWLRSWFGDLCAACTSPGGPIWISTGITSVPGGGRLLCLMDMKL